MENKNCEICKNSFLPKLRKGKIQRFCSKTCSIQNLKSKEVKELARIGSIGKIVSQETKEKIRKSNTGKKLSFETKEKISIAHKGKKFSYERKIEHSKILKGIKKTKRSEEHCKKLSESIKKDYEKGRESPFKKIWEENPNFLRGENNYNYKKDRNTLVKSEKKHLDGKYREWMLAVKNRDCWKCKINNSDCSGRLESHHILDWKNYPELRYEINNGITLCHAHHPMKRAEEKRLAPLFMELVSVSK